MVGKNVRLSCSQENVVKHSEGLHCGICLLFIRSPPLCALTAFLPKLPTAHVAVLRVLRSSSEAAFLWFVLDLLPRILLVHLYIRTRNMIIFFNDVLSFDLYNTKIEVVTTAFMRLNH